MTGGRARLRQSTNADHLPQARVQLKRALPYNARSTPAKESEAMPVILAHGALGPFDEIIFLSIAVIFLAMMGVSWVRSQQLQDEELDAPGDCRETDADRFELE